MICTSCFRGEYKTIRIQKEVIINNQPVLIDNVECEKCSVCDDIIFTHQQSIELDKKRINIEFGSKPVLTPYELVLLRKVLNMSLEEICDLLHVGKNTYGRWERGEVIITPSMNLLVHNFMDRFRDAKVNLIEAEMQTAIKEAKGKYFDESLSLGEFIRKILNVTKILPEVICKKIDLESEYFNQIQNNEVSPEKIPVEISGNISIFFQLTIDNLRQLLNKALAVYAMRDKISFIHARKSNYGQAGIASQSRSINKIIEKYLDKEKSISTEQTISETYMKQVEDYINKKIKFENK